MFQTRLCQWYLEVDPGVGGPQRPPQIKQYLFLGAHKRRPSYFLLSTLAMQGAT